MRPLYVGIDLGTTNSAVAIFDGEQLTLVRERGGSTLTPSVVRIDARGSATVGHKARRFIDSDPRNTRAEFKRLMGTTTPSDFPAAKVQRTPEELSAEVLRSLRADVQDQLGVLPERAVISVPALFELPQSAATTKAAQLAGFRQVELIQEPIASALAAGWTSAEEPGYWLVYDLGGGTFDASLLETRDGHLRVVGHDGDNFLGGRDFDLAIVDWALAEVSRSSSFTVSRADAQHQAGLRKLKHAAEEAKIELGRQSEATLQLPGLFTLPNGETVDVDLVLEAAQLTTLVAPLIERSLQVCQRLLQLHEVTSLRRVVLVGGPTMMPALRRRVAEALAAPLSEGLDPMTLVAQGAALFAATANLDARPPQAAAPQARKLWLQHPAMSADLSPHVLGRLLPGSATLEGGLRLRLERSDGLWRSPEAALDEEGAFIVQVELLPRRANVFRLVLLSEGGEELVADPATLTIVQGMTISDPPLSRSIGVALANDRVHSYFERGTPLPARRTFIHHTVETITSAGSNQGESDQSERFALKIPIVQGEYEQAHLCRLVGTLTLPSDMLRESLPAGTAVELSLQLDRGGQLSARALLPSGQVFEHVAHLMVPEAQPQVLAASASAASERLAQARSEAFRRREPKVLERLQAGERLLSEVQRDVTAAVGGDADAAQKARRSLLELDALMEELDSERRWPELCDEARRSLASAASWVAQHGTPAEQQLLSEVTQAAQQAQAQRQVAELQRHLRVARELSSAAYYRHPEAWRWAFDSAASEAESARDLVKAQALVREGRAVIAAGELTKLRDIVERLWKLLPADADSRRLSFESGVR